MQMEINLENIVGKMEKHKELNITKVAKKILNAII
jgi:hypothetical protein